jgi:sec-independent protein translocase protein TatA
MFGLGWQELVIVLVIIMIIFGAGKLPEVAKSLGTGVKEFRQEANATGDGLAAATSTGSENLEAVTAERTKVRADEI